MHLSTCLFAVASTLALSIGTAQAQTTFGSSCAGASGVTPELAVSGIVQSGQQWTLEVTAPGGIGLGYLLVGFSNTSASLLGGVPLPLDLGTLFVDPLWGGCDLTIDPSYLILPYTFDPNVNGGLFTKNFLGFDAGTVYMQVLNIDADFVTRIAGVSQGMLVTNVNQFVPGMVPMPPGTFQMGSNAPSGAPYFGSPIEQPVHPVTISEPFWIGQYEVTQGEYQAVMGVNPSFFIGSNRPVEQLSWFDAVAYCQSLTALEGAAGNVPAGYEYRLPTEAEWEYACRAGTTTEFAVGTGVALTCSDARFGFSHHTSSSCGSNGTVNVGSYAPNAWGLFDMHGNVREWCLDSYAAYAAAHVTDPFVTGGSGRVFRGGSFFNDSNTCRSAVRVSTSPSIATGSRGFRVVLAPVLAP